VPKRVNILIKYIVKGTKSGDGAETGKGGAENAELVPKTTKMHERESAVKKCRNWWLTANG